VAEDSFTIVIDENGLLTVPGRAAARRLAVRAGRYRLIPSPADLVILERIDPAKVGEGKTATGVVLAGDIDRVGGLIDVIHFVQGNSWSGHLTIISGSARKTLYFKRGDVSTAASNVSEDRIGAILYRYGMITAADLEKALAQVTQEHRFGQVLVENGTLTAHDLYQYVRKQVEEIFYSVLVMRRGEYYFYRTDDAEGPPSQLHLATKQLLFEGVRRIDEMSYFQEKLPGPDVILAVRHPPPHDEKLPPKEARVLSLVDGVRDIGAIARESHLGEFEATKILFQLLHSGWVQLRPRSPTGAHGVGSRPQTIDTYAEIVDTFNQVYAKIYAAVAAKGKQGILIKGLDSFFASVAEFAPLFVGVSLSAEGTVPRDMLLANLEMAPTEKKVDYLHRGLNELLFFELFTAGEAVDRNEELELHQRLNQILRDVPGREAAG
jgi:Domain of unknown function (DUF4388)